MLSRFFKLSLIAVSLAPRLWAQQDIGKTFYAPSAALQQKTDSIYAALSAAEKAAQMIMTASSTAPQIGYPFAKAQKLMEDGIVGNIVFLKGTQAAFKGEVKAFTKIQQDKRGLPPLFACDCEPTLVPYKWTDIKGIKPASEQKEAAVVAAETQKINRAMADAGVRLNFAPIVDKAANKAVINKRSFGEDDKTIVALAGQFVASSQSEGIAATLKHFPGHGAVTGDTHKESVYINGTLTELQNFSDLLHAGSRPVAVMIGHIVVKNNARYDTKGMPASISKTIITDLLQKELGFDGLIVTDAMNMGAVSKIPDADWLAAVAGADLVLMPGNARALHEKLTKALEGNDALAKQFERSVKKIIRLKLALAATEPGR